MTFDIRCKVDNAALLLRLRNGEKRMAFAVVNAINATAKKIQQAEFERVRKQFIIRTPNSARLFFGTLDRPGGVAARLGPPPDIKTGRYSREVMTGAEAVGGRRNVLLPIFEAGGVKQPTAPSKSIAIPLLGRPARPSIRSIVPPAFTFSGLAFKAFRRGRVVSRRRRGRTVSESVFGEFGKLSREKLALHGVQWKGKQRTFILQSSRGTQHGGVFQRIGAGRGDVRLIYKFVSSSPLDARLGFVHTAQSTANQWFSDYLDAEVAKTLIFHASEIGLAPQ